MASLRKMRGKYYVRIRYNGKEKSIPTYHTNRRDAEIVLRKYQQNEQEVKLNLTEHLLDQNIKIKDCTSFFRKHYPTEKGITASTMRSYNWALTDFIECFRYIEYFRDLNSRHYSLLVDYLQNHYSVTTSNIRLRGIRAFLNYVFEKEYVRKLPFKVKQIKTDKHPPKIITPSELDAIYARVEDPALLATFRTLEVTGMRVGELKNSYRNEEFIHITKSKGRNERIIPIPVDHIDNYDLARETLYSESWISRSFTRLVKEVGIEKGLTCHALRHSFAYRMWLEVRDLQMVREMLGHSSVKVTEIYTRVPIDFLKQVFKDRSINQGVPISMPGKA